MLGSLAHICVAVAAASAPSSPLTFGGHVEGGQVCEGAPLVILNHTERPLQPLFVDIFVDDETSPSVSFQPSMAVGQGFPDLMQPQNMRWDAGGHFGRNTISTHFLRLQIPFARTVRAEARWAAPRCHESYFNVRGTEVQAGSASLVSLPGYGPLPAAARMVLQKIQNVTFEPFQLVPLFTAPPGKTGVILLTALSLSALAFQHPGFPHRVPPVRPSPGNHYMEGCIYLYPRNDSTYPGLVVGTGVEDYFESSYGFGDPWSFVTDPASCSMPDVFGSGYCMPTFAFARSGLLHHSLSSWDATERYAMYRSHMDDPITFQDGGALFYRVGDLTNATARAPRCQVLGPRDAPGVRPSGPTQPTNVTSYVWAYVWDAAG